MILNIFYILIRRETALTQGGQKSTDVKAQNHLLKNSWMSTLDELAWPSYSFSVALKAPLSVALVGL